MSTDAITAKVAAYLRARRAADERKGRKSHKSWHRTSDQYVSDERVALRMIAMWAKDAGYELAAELLDTLVENAIMQSKEAA